MKKQVGIWIDHKDAFVVFAGEGAEEPQGAEPGIAKHFRFSDHHAHDGAAEDRRDLQHATHLGKYYDEVIAYIHDAQSVLLFGPGEAKGELEKRLEGKGLGGRIVGVETVDRMTDHQIAAKVRQHYEQ